MAGDQPYRSGDPPALFRVNVLGTSATLSTRCPSGTARFTVSPPAADRAPQHATRGGGFTESSADRLVRRATASRDPARESDAKRRVFALCLRIHPVIRGRGQPAEDSRLSGGRERVGFRLFVQRLGGQVDAAWPHDGARLSIEFNLGKIGRIVKRLQDACPALRREVDVTGRPVAKQQPEHVVANHGHACNDRKVALAHRNTLRQRRDTEQRLALARPFPVRHDLGPVQARPLLDEHKRPVLKAAGKHGAVRRNRRPAA